MQIFRREYRCQAMKRPRARSATLVRGRFITGIFQVCVDKEES